MKVAAAVEPVEHRLDGDRHEYVEAKRTRGLRERGQPERIESLLDEQRYLDGLDEADGV